MNREHMEYELDPPPESWKARGKHKDIITITRLCRWNTNINLI